MAHLDPQTNSLLTLLPLLPSSFTTMDNNIVVPHILLHFFLQCKALAIYHKFVFLFCSVNHKAENKRFRFDLICVGLALKDFCCEFTCKSVTAESVAKDHAKKKKK